MKKKVLVIGYGISGQAAAAFLRQQGCEVIAVDKKPMAGILPDRADLPLEGISQVILSPGVPQTHPLVRRAEEQQIEVIGEMELGLRHLNQRCFGITGANGKTTTVLLATHILREAGKKACALGNVGASLSGYLLAPNPEEIVIIELSSFQLETVTARCLEAALVLNITPNHLDRYPSMAAYVGAKARIQQCVKEGGNTFISKQVAEEFGEHFKEALLFEKDIAPINELSYIQLSMPSKQSVQAAYLICKRCGVSDVAFLEGIKTFQKPAHRIEWVAEIDGVSYYNDSKSSNIQSVMHAVERFTGSVVLIIGGVHKGSSYLPWIGSFRGKVRCLIAYGQAAAMMERELAPFFPFQKVDRFPEAVARAKAIAKKEEIVLLSPGCSSYDQFASFEHRGEEFKRLVKEGKV